jgi:hypothetical protein
VDHTIRWGSRRETATVELIAVVKSATAGYEKAAA